jgi:hypothetical protein
MQGLATIFVFIQVYSSQKQAKFIECIATPLMKNLYRVQPHTCDYWASGTLLTSRHLPEAEIKLIAARK